MLRLTCAGLVVGLLATATAAPDKVPPSKPVSVTLPGPAPEIGKGLAHALPAVPSFELPPSEPGFEDPRVLRVRGRKLLGTKISVKGYIIWIYNCVEAIRLPKESAAKTQKRIDEDPTQCERPKFYLGSTKNTPPEKALWVVDVPRPPNKLEKERLPREEIKNWPKVPKLKVGDYVVITGEFNTSSPHSERNSDGLLVFESLAPAKPAKTKATPVASPEPAKVAPAKPAAVALPAIDPAKAEASKQSLMRGNRAHGNKQFEEAAKAYREAIAQWPQNHLAYFGLGGVLGGQANWAASYDAFMKAVELAPDQPMYQMWAGVSAYEKAVSAARLAEAKKQGRKPEEVQVDLSSISFADATPRLELALALEPDLWRAHYYLGRVYRNIDQPRSAAQELSSAIKSKPTEQGPWVALAELYRKWDYTQEAQEVAKLGTSQLSDAESSDLWFVLGMAYDDVADLSRSIEAYTKCLELKADNYKAQFQRGQAYFKLGKYTEAQTDLDAFLKAAVPSMEFAKQQASKMLMDIAAKKPAKK